MSACCLCGLSSPSRLRTPGRGECGFGLPALLLLLLVSSSLSLFAPSRLQGCHACHFRVVFGDRTSFRAKGLRRTPCNRNFTAVCGDQTSFRATGLRRLPCNRNFRVVFGDRPSFRAKGLRRTPPCNRNFRVVFGDRPSFRAKGLRRTP